MSKSPSRESDTSDENVTVERLHSGSEMLGNEFLPLAHDATPVAAASSPIRPQRHAARIALEHIKHQFDTSYKSVTSPEPGIFEEQYDELVPASEKAARKRSAKSSSGNLASPRPRRMPELIESRDSQRAVRRQERDVYKFSEVDEMTSRKCSLPYLRQRFHEMKNPQHTPQYARKIKLEPNVDGCEFTEALLELPSDDQTQFEGVGVGECTLVVSRQRRGRKTGTIRRTRTTVRRSEDMFCSACKFAAPHHESAHRRISDYGAKRPVNSSFIVVRFHEDPRQPKEQMEVIAGAAKPKDKPNSSAEASPPDAYYSCAQCGFEFRYMFCLTSHVRDNQCKQLEAMKDQAPPSAAKSELEEVDADSENADVTDGDLFEIPSLLLEGLFVCKTCPLKFATQKGFLQHMACCGVKANLDLIKAALGKTSVE